MARPCTVCKSAHTLAVDRALARSESLAVIARRYRISVDALARHRKHAKTVLPQPSNQYIGSSETEFDSIVTDLGRLQAAAENRNDVRCAVIALRERLAAWRVRADVEGRRTSATSPPGEVHRLEVQRIYREMEEKLLNPETSAENYRYYQRVLAERGYSPQQIDDLLAVFGYRLPPEGVPFALVAALPAPATKEETP